MKKYIFFDIDGTLRSKTDYQIPKSAYQAILALQKKGYKLGIATGRGLFSARMFAEELGMNFVISDGGRCVMEDGKVIYENFISESQVKAVQTFCDKHHIPIGYSNHYAIHSSSPIFTELFDLDQTIICSQKKTIDISKLFGLTKLYLYGDRDLIESSDAVRAMERHWLREKLCVIEHMHKDEGIAILEKMYDIKKKDMIAFGDDLNDVTMFQHCGTSVCMGNGNNQTKEAASYIAPHIDQDGILNACLDLQLITKEDL